MNWKKQVKELEKKLKGNEEQLKEKDEKIEQKDKELNESRCKAQMMTQKEKELEEEKIVRMRTLEKILEENEVICTFVRNCLPCLDMVCLYWMQLKIQINLHLWYPNKNRRPHVQEQYLL